MGDPCRRSLFSSARRDGAELRQDAKVRTICPNNPMDWVSGMGGRNWR